MTSGEPENEMVRPTVSRLLLDPPIQSHLPSPHLAVWVRKGMYLESSCLVKSPAAPLEPHLCGYGNQPMGLWFISWLCPCSAIIVKRKIVGSLLRFRCDEFEKSIPHWLPCLVSSEIISFFIVWCIRKLGTRSFVNIGDLGPGVRA